MSYNMLWCIIGRQNLTCSVESWNTGKEPTMFGCWENLGKPSKTMGKPWEDHGKPWENHWKLTLHVGVSGAASKIPKFRGLALVPHQVSKLQSVGRALSLEVRLGRQWTTLLYMHCIVCIYIYICIYMYICMCIYALHCLYIYIYEY